MVKVIKENNAKGSVSIEGKTQFSKLVNPRDAEGVEALRRWLDWFEKRKIKAVLAERDGYYAVYRNGLVGV